MSPLADCNGRAFLLRIEIKMGVKEGLCEKFLNI